MSDIPAGYPLSGRVDEDLALRIGLCRLLCRTFALASGTVTGYIADGSDGPAAPPPNPLSLYPEWPQGTVQQTLPSATILDAVGTYSDVKGTLDETPIEEGGTYWEEGPHGVALLTCGEYEVPLSILVAHDTGPGRAALMAGIRGALTPGEDERDSVVVDLGDLYWGRRARYRLTGIERRDAEDAAGQNRRVAILSVRASIAAVKPVASDVLRHTEFVDPADPDGKLLPVT